MNPIAEQLNQVIAEANPHLFDMLSAVGKQLFFPKGILSQSAEAKEKAHRINATAGIAKEAGRTMCFDSVSGIVSGIRPSESLTYAPSFGLPELRRAWQSELFQKNPSLAGKPISLPVVTCGITHAISMFGDIWLDAGDPVVLPEMMWGNYNMILNVRRGARIVGYPLFDENRGFNLAAFQSAVTRAAETAGKVTVILNFPQNPSGYTLTVDEAETIAAILTRVADAGTHVIAATDDSYFGLFYDDAALKESIFARLCGIHPNLLAVKMDGATKESFVWGLRVGFLTYGCCIDGDAGAVYDALEKKTAGCIRGNISNASHLGQRIVLKAMEDSSYAAEKAAKFEILSRRAARVKTVLADPRYAAAWDVYPFNSGYFMCLRLKTVDAEALRVHLLDRYGIGLIAIGKDNLRIAFSCVEEDDIQELFDTIYQGVKDLDPAVG